MLTPAAPQPALPSLPAPAYEGLFVEPTYADGQPYARDEDDEAPAIITP